MSLTTCQKSKFSGKQKCKKPGNRQQSHEKILTGIWITINEDSPDNDDK